MMATLSLSGCGGSDHEDEIVLSSAKAITAFSITSPAATGIIDENAKTISVNVPYDTDVTILIATFTTTGASVTVNATPQISGTTANNFKAR